MAAEQGHTVEFKPPYHSRLQPIELVWAYVKGIVGRAYTVSTTFADVRARLDAALDALPSSVIYKCIMNSVAEVNRLDKYIKDLEVADFPFGPEHPKHQVTPIVPPVAMSTLPTSPRNGFWVPPGAH